MRTSFRRISRNFPTRKMVRESKDSSINLIWNFRRRRESRGRNLAVNVV